MVYLLLYGTTQLAYRAVERNVYNRVRRFLVERHKVRTRGIRRFPSEKVFGELGVLLPKPMIYPNAACLEVKSVGKPDAVVLHVRFDERRWETEPMATAPTLDSTAFRFNEKNH